MVEDLYNEAKSHFNEPVLVGFNVGRLVGYGEDNEDCYLIVVFPQGRKAKVSFVGGYTYLDCLRGRNQVQSAYTPEVWDDYYRIDSLLEINGAPREMTFLEETGFEKL